MKLSEMSTDKFADTLCVISPAVANIAEDKDVVAAVTETANAAQMGNNVKLLAVIGRKLLPALVKEHRADAYLIIAALTGKPINTISAQPLKETVNDVRSIIDTDLMDFFTPAAPPEST